jgi:hypothetical protein
MVGDVIKTTPQVYIPEYGNAVGMNGLHFPALLLGSHLVVSKFTLGYLAIFGQNRTCATSPLRTFGEARAVSLQEIQK